MSTKSGGAIRKVILSHDYENHGAIKKEGGHSTKHRRRDVHN